MDDALRRMKTGLSSFARYVPRDVVRSLLGSGGEAKLAGEVKTLTVFFSDIAGFTTLAEQMPPDALVELLGGYFDESTRILADKRGTVDKFIGDGIMAFWGAPEALPGGPDEHAALACEAAVLYQRRIRELREEGEAWAQSVSVRIGLATGPVLVGNIGSHERMNYTVMGDTVNLAARLEGLCKAYGVGILVAEATYTLARERVVGRPVDVVAVKGKAQGTKVYEMLALRADADEVTRRVEELSEQAFAAYVGRDFSVCAARLAEVLALRPGDKAAEVLLGRAEGYQKNPPPPEWSGVYVATEK
jgi:adenylate cyclase